MHNASNQYCALKRTNQLMLEKFTVGCLVYKKTYAFFSKIHASSSTWTTPSICVRF